MAMHAASVSVENQLYEAVAMGDLPALVALAQQYPLLVHLASFARSRNLLHIATVAEREDIMDVLLRMSPVLARDVDDKKSSALHVAAAQGRPEIVGRLFLAAPEMCWRVDDQGMNPVHVAASYGHVEALQVFLGDDLGPGRERLERGQNVLTLCVKRDQLEAFRFLVGKLPDLVSVKDDDGKTVYDWAVRGKRDEMVKYLLEECPADIHRKETIFREITGMTMVVVGLIAATACKAANNPPGGVWQEDTPSHRAGQAVMASTHPELYKHFTRANTTAFVSALLVLCLVAVRAPTRSFVFVEIIWYATWVALTSIGVSFGVSAIMINPVETLTVGQIIAIVASAFVAILVLVRVCTNIQEMHSVWRRRRELYQDVTVADRIFRRYHQLRGDAGRRAGEAFTMLKTAAGLGWVVGRG